MNLKHYVNKLVNLTIKVNGYTQSISGHISNVGKEYILFLDQDSKERPIQRKSIVKVTLI